MESLQGLNSWARIHLGNGAKIHQSAIDVSVGPDIFFLLDEYELPDGHLVKETIQVVCTYREEHYYFTCLVDPVTGARLPDSIWEEEMVKQTVCGFYRPGCQPPVSAIQVAFV